MALHSFNDVAAGCPLRCDLTDDDDDDRTAGTRRVALLRVRALERASARTARSSPFFRFRLFCSFSPYASRALSGRVSLPPLFRSLSLPRCFSSLIVSRPASPPLPAVLSPPSLFTLGFLSLLLSLSHTRVGRPDCRHRRRRRALASSVSRVRGCEKSSVRPTDRPSVFSSLRNDDRADRG